MNTKDDKNVEISLTDDTFTNEMGIHSTPTSQIDESATESVELNTVQLTPTSTRYESKTDEITAIMQLLLKIDSKCEKINDKLEKFETITDKILESVNNMFSTQIDLSLIHICCC